VASLDRWRAFCTAFGACGPVEKWYSRLSEAYCQPGRAYHNMKHIGFCLEQLESLLPHAERSGALEMAIWFHDAVYRPGADDNEERSAALARQAATELGMDSGFAADVYRLVLATRHKGKPEAADEASICDVDLAVLGASQDVFEEYEAGIRQEYSQVEERAYRLERTRVLMNFMTRESIYATERFRERYDQSARSNLERALRRLRDVP